MNKKICILNHGLASGGTDSFVINLTYGLINNGYDVTIAMAVDELNTQFREQEALSMGAKLVTTSDLGGILPKLRHCYRLYKLLKN